MYMKCMRKYCSTVMTHRRKDCFSWLPFKWAKKKKLWHVRDQKPSICKGSFVMNCEANCDSFLLIWKDQKKKKPMTSGWFNYHNISILFWTIPQSWFEITAVHVSDSVHTDELPNGATSVTIRIITDTFCSICVTRHSWLKSGCCQIPSQPGTACGSAVEGGKREDDGGRVSLRERIKTTERTVTGSLIN